MALALKWQSYTEFCLNYILEIHGILGYALGFQYTKILHGSGILTCCNFKGILTGFLIYLGFRIGQF